jgi:tetratricopeptide (TPR) repeat protein
MTLPEEVSQRVDNLSEQGNQALDRGDTAQAIAKWEEALDLLPKPVTDWEATEWLYASIGDAYFSVEKYNEAKGSLYNALNCSLPEGNPFVYLRLGQTLFKLGETDKSAEMLLRACMLEGKEIFDEVAGEQYLNLLRQRNLI